MTSSHAPAQPVRTSLHALLLLAAERAAEALARGDGIFASDLQEEFGRIARLALAASAAGRAGRWSADDVAAIGTIPHHHVETYRAAVLHEVSRSDGTIGARELAGLLVALEAIGNDDTSPGHEGFTRHLVRSDAVSAIVEIAHDMRSPLTSILFLVDTLRRAQSGPVTPVQERQLGLIYGAALGLNTLASDVIDAVRGGRRLVDGHPVPFSVGEVIMAVCDTVRPISEEKDLPITQTLLEVDGRLGYPGAISRVLLNLVTNALKYTNRGSVSVGCTELTDNVVRFWIQDTGEGIPPHVMTMLFDGFRPSASGMRFSNAGLGLAICQNFLGAMGSTLEVQSSPESGTRFTFDLGLPRA